MLWLLTTALATAVAWAAVSQVTARTVEPLPAGVPSDPAPTGPPTDPSPDPAPTSPASPQPATSPATSDPGTPTATTKSYELAGGSVTIAFSSGSVDVVSVTPRPGFAVKDINRHGALDVEVELRSEDARSRLRAWWDAGPRERIDEDR